MNYWEVHLSTHIKSRSPCQIKRGHDWWCTDKHKVENAAPLAIRQLNWFIWNTLLFSCSVAIWTTLTCMPLFGCIDVANEFASRCHQADDKPSSDTLGRLFMAACIQYAFTHTCKGSISWLQGFTWLQSCAWNAADHSQCTTMHSPCGNIQLHTTHQIGRGTTMTVSVHQFSLSIQWAPPPRLLY